MARRSARDQRPALADEAYRAAGFEMVVRLWQRHACCVYRAGRKRRSAGVFIHSLIFTSLRDALVYHKQRTIRPLSPRTSLLRRVRNGVDDRSAYGADVFVWRLQISARDDLDHRHPATDLYVRNGIHRAATPVGFDRSMVGRGRGGTSRAYSYYWRLGGALHPRWQYHRRRHT